MIHLEKNEIYEVEIVDISVDGSGIGKVDGIALFIKDAVIGDVVKAKIMKMKKKYGFARLMEIVTPSPHRVEPRCELHRQCGGCQIQTLDYPEQLRFKQKKVEDHLKIIGKFEDCTVEPVIGMEEPFRYRNKSQFPVARSKGSKNGAEGKLVSGFYALRTHDIIPTKDCQIGIEQNGKIVQAILRFMEKNNISAYDETTGTGLVRHILIRYSFSREEIMVCLVINGNVLPEQKKFIRSLTKIPGMTSICLSVNTEWTNVIMGRDIIYIWGKHYITDDIMGVEFRISPISFYQINSIQTEKLYEKALEFAQLKPEDTVWDLYCGIGTIGLCASSRVKKVYGVEIVSDAVRDARINAQVNHITNAKFFIGKAEEVLPNFYSSKDQVESEHPDVIIVDPPRKGCDPALLETILKVQPDRMVYVSCDSATLARDLRILADGGYQILKVQPFDMFPQTVHVESCVLLERMSN